MVFTESLEKEVKGFVRNWDNKHPIDYAWRKHFNIPFNSTEHRAVSFIDQLIWYEEDKFIKVLSELEDGQSIDAEGRVIDIENNAVSMTEDEIDDAFEKM